jgi:hypothetical protein
MVIHILKDETLDQYIIRNLKISIHERNLKYIHKHEHIKYKIIVEILLYIISVITLLKMLYPELFKPVVPTGVVSGGLQYNNAPVADATVTLYQTDKITEVAVATSAADGTYTLPAEPFGNYHVTCILLNADSTWLQGDQDITIDGSTLTTDLTLVNTTDPIIYQLLN